MPSRRTHTKSRHGCVQCKASHVKCDLKRPKCARCVKTEKNCGFQNREGDSGPGTPSEALQTQQVAPVPEPELSLGSNTISWDDLELLHHFITVTANTFADRSDIQEMWKVQIPKLAMDHKFLMHLLFSVTALHMANLDTEKQSTYVDRALRHHNVALPHFSSKFPTATHHNVASIFAGATLIVVSSLNLSFAHLEHDPSAAVDEMFGIFILLRGIKLVYGETWERVQESEIAPLFANRELDSTIVLEHHTAEALATLKSNSQVSSDALDRTTYLDAVEGLERCFKILSTESQDFGMVLQWPIAISQEYMALLSSRRPMALVVLAYYAVVLHEVRDKWWVSGWGTKLAEEINKILEDKWKTLIMWPLKRIIPTFNDSI
ncbi:hypothetical protein BKA65DRAFT_434169 [Rhexocercosporidium sp. MPI-PUGE-AT-0058]|nr:hypothetical protein BKA65DRAFT_434169 [Rhexocercosporidium sp. MPI-PUGE-AT-0058]